MDSLGIFAVFLSIAQENSPKQEDFPAKKGKPRRKAAGEGGRAAGVFMAKANCPTANAAGRS
jgi:hypothetical protein